jgi:Legume-like lectin family
VGGGGPDSRFFTILEKTLIKEWIVEMSFSVTGKKVGGDGFAFWYTTQDTNIRSPYGKSTDYRGLAVLFDSSDDEAGVSAESLERSERLKLQSHCRMQKVADKSCSR